MDPGKLQQFFDISRSLLCTADAATNTFVDLNPAWERTLGWSLEELRARPFTEFIHPEDLQPTFAIIAEMVQHGREAVQFENRYRHKDGSWVSLSWYGVVRGGQFYSSAWPITEYKQTLEALKLANAELRRLADAASHVQQETLAALSTPLLRISGQILVLPLIGAVDSGRMQRVVDVLLHGVVSNRAKVAILDITGVDTADLEVANGLIQAAKSVGLLGARVVITGISPEVARTLASLGADWGDLVPLGDLAGGIEYAMATVHGRRERR